MFERSTESLCPVCLARIPARLEQRGEDTVLVKRCPDHGRFEAVVWRGAPDLARWSRPKLPSPPPSPARDRHAGCPFDCGLCPEHNQHTCTALIEVTWRCDLGCPVCFACSGGRAPDDPSPEDIDRLYSAVLKASGPCNLQLSGGEPTMRDDLPRLIARAKERGFPFVQLNTNGLRIASEPGYAAVLASAGLDSVFLQFDGIDDSAHRALRGRPLARLKHRAITALAEAGVGIVLVPTVLPGANDHQLGDILRLGASLSPAVRGVHFQPVSYFGRYPAPPDDAARITLPEVMRALEEQTGGLVKAADFLPPGCEHERCSFHANYLVQEDGRLQRLSAPQGQCCHPPKPAAVGADKAKAFVRRQWAGPAEIPRLPDGADDLDRFIARAKTHVLAVSAMAFQDAWTLDLERLKGCCIHVAAPDGRLIPFCAYNLTAQDGTPLYRRTLHAHAPA